MDMRAAVRIDIDFGIVTEMGQPVLVGDPQPLYPETGVILPRSGQIDRNFLHQVAGDRDIAESVEQGYR